MKGCKGQKLNSRLWTYFVNMVSNFAFRVSVENINATNEDHRLGSILPQMYTFLPGYSVYSLTWRNWLINDLVYKGDEAFKLQLSLVDPTSQPYVVIGKQDTLVVVIKDNDPVT